MTATGRYLREMHRIHSSGEAVAETSYYPPLAELLDSVGRGLSPPVHCVVTIRDTGAGLPDLGLFLRRPADRVEGWGGFSPERGVAEAKPVTANLDALVVSQQVRRYLERYGKVLVTNFRAFQVVTVDEYGEPRPLERYEVSDSGEAFWAAAATPDRTASDHDDALLGFLRRALTLDAPIISPEDLAWFLAAYARTGLGRTESVELPALAAVREALEETLGVNFEDDKGEHFFRSTLVQTLFYGVFSAWVLWARRLDDDTAAKFQWRRQAAWELSVPMVRILFEQIATPSRLGPLRLDEVLDWAEDALNRVVRRAFFARFDERQAVQYFYEPFLSAFDPELRKDLGVWYTPPEVVTYMTRQVDRLLVEELGIQEGLADERVYVLDPCTGTGSYLVEVLKIVADRLASRHGDALVGAEVKAAAMNRVLGFEILPAPFVVAHLQLGLMLEQLDAPLDRDSGERVGVYLTNTLTGWMDETEHPTIPFPELAEEHDAARDVKQDRPILVVLGNPPYNAFAGVATREEGDLVGPYKQGLSEDWGITRNYLDDLYVRFWRVAERRVAEMTGTGVVSFISSFSYLHGPSFVVMRRHLLDSFDSISIDCLNGDSRETGKVTPDGDPDPSVFSTEFSPQGIQVGTAIATMVRKSSHAPCEEVLYRDFWGVNKRSELLDSPDGSRPYSSVIPLAQSRFSFRPLTAGDDYYSWPQLPDLAETAPLLGLNENRGGSLFDIDREALVARMRTYLDPDVNFDDLPPELKLLKRDWARFDPRRVREEVLAQGSFDEAKVVRFIDKPLDLRWAYIETASKLWNESRDELVRHANAGVGFLLARPHSPRADDGAPVLYSSTIGNQAALHKAAYYIPLWTVPRTSLFEEGDPRPNLSKSAIAWLKELGVDPADQGEDVWFHALAIGFASRYLDESADAIRAGWPRVPLPDNAELLSSSASLGRRLAALLDPAQPVDGVDAGHVEAPLSGIGIASRAAGGGLQQGVGDLDVTVGWGYLQNESTVMPGSGRLEIRPFDNDELAVFAAAEAEALMTRGETVDVYLNEVAFWRNVPADVWDLRIGGFPIAKKWLSYRDMRVLGRSLSVAEVREFTALVRRLSAVLLLGSDLNLNYLDVCERAYPWHSG